MSLKTHPPKMQFFFKFDEYKLLDTQIDRLAEAMDKMNIRSLGRQISKTDLISLIFMVAEVAEIIPTITEAMTKKGNFRQRSYDRNKRGYF